MPAYYRRDDFVVHRADGSLETGCPYLQNPASGNSVKKRSSYSAQPETGRNGATILAMYVDGWLALSKPEGNVFQSDIGRQWRIPRAECRWVGFDYKVRGVRGQRGSLLGRVFRRE